MKRVAGMLWSVALAAVLLAASAAGQAAAQDAPKLAPDGYPAGDPPPPDEGTRIPLWKTGAPGFEKLAKVPEVSRDYWTRNVNNPSLTAYLPDPQVATGAAVILVPGGAHTHLVTQSEGRAPGRWFARRGVAAFVLRYRLFRVEGSPYSLEDARADMERAVRLVRHDAAKLGVDPKKIGVMGFSAGGELARMVTLSSPVPPRGKADDVDRESARPDFGILIFPGPLHAEETITKDAPPLLLAATNDDECCSQPIIDVMDAYRKAGAGPSAEMHMYAAGGHAFNMGERTDIVALQRWPARIMEWMVDRRIVPASVLDVPIALEK